MTMLKLMFQKIENLENIISEVVNRGDYNLVGLKATRKKVAKTNNTRPQYKCYYQSHHQPTRNCHNNF